MNHLEAFLMSELNGRDSIADEHFGRFEQYLLKNTADKVQYSSFYSMHTLHRLCYSKYYSRVVQMQGRRTVQLLTMFTLLSSIL